MGNFKITANQITFNFTQNSFWNEASFNGFTIRDDAVSFSGISIDPVSNMVGLNNSAISVGADGHSFSLNWQSLSFTTSTVVVLDLRFAAAPQVTISLFSDSGSSSTDNITNNPTIQGSGDANALVTTTEGRNTVGTAIADASGHWSFAAAGLADGSHTLTASETNSSGTGTAAITFVLDRAPPNVGIALLSDTGLSLTDNVTSNPALVGSGDANAVVTIRENGVTLGTTTANASGDWTFSPVLSDGVHSLTASETDTAGNTGTTALTFTLDRAPPALAVMLAVDTGASSTDNITNNAALAGSGDANAIVTISENGAALGTTTANGAGDWTFGPLLSDGAHTLTVSETDTAGNTGTTALTFTLDRTPPAVGVMLAVDSGFSSTDHITNNAALVGSGDANSIVTVSEGGTILGTVATDASGSWAFNPSLPDGTHTLTFSDSDAAGNVGTAILTFTFDTTPPQVSIQLSQATGGSSTSNPALAGSGDANATVTIKEGSVVLGTVLADAAGNWTFTPTLADGSHTLTASETDIAGNSNSASLSFTLSTARSLFSFIYTYNDGKEAYSGTVADDGSLGYQVGQTISRPGGAYTILGEDPNGTSQASGTVFVTDYRHAGPGQASYVPQKDGQGQPSGTGGLGSETDAVLGTDGAYHAFDPNNEASFVSNGLFGFIYSYVDGNAYYGGTVSDDGSLGYGRLADSGSPYLFIRDGGGAVLGQYYLFRIGGTTTLPKGSVNVTSYRDATIGVTFAVDHGGNGGKDGTSGLGTEVGQFFVDGNHFIFSATLEAIDPPVLGAEMVLLYDVTTGHTDNITGAPYAGPVAGLARQFINLSGDDQNVVVSTDNWFIHTGPGNDAIVVHGGINVVDGGTGSNFLTGGSGTDTFFVDDRGAPADIWSTVNGFDAGNSATVWGVTPNDFTVAWFDGEGAAGYTGLTLHAMAAGKPIASLTLAGYSTADLQNGRLSVSYSDDAASHSPYLYIMRNS